MLYYVVFMAPFSVQCYIMCCLNNPILCTMLYYVVFMAPSSLQCYIMHCLNGPLLCTADIVSTSQGKKTSTVNSLHNTLPAPKEQ